MTGKTQQLCPCGKQMAYQNCCEKFHLGLSRAHTAEELMRSRYSAFAKKLSSYLMQTLHPEKVTPKTLVELNESFVDCLWLKLNITARTGGLPNVKIGTVSFVADYKIGDKKFQMKENSLFIKINDEWFYKEPLSLNFS